MFAHYWEKQFSTPFNTFFTGNKTMSIIHGTWNWNFIHTIQDYSILFKTYFRTYLLHTTHIVMSSSQVPHRLASCSSCRVSARWLTRRQWTILAIYIIDTWNRILDLITGTWLRDIDVNALQWDALSRLLPPADRPVRELGLIHKNIYFYDFWVRARRLT